MSDLKTNPELLSLIRRARDVVAAMSPAERRTMIAAQRRSYVVGEAAAGSDEDETAYRIALIENDQAALTRLREESTARAMRAEAWLKEQGL